MSNYILDLRREVGHRPLLQLGASVIVEDARERVLLQRRRDNGMWGYSGGSVELYESVEDAAARELLEETGLLALSLVLYGLYSGAGMEYVYPNGDQVSNVDAVFLCREYSGELCPQLSEVLELRWFSREELPPTEELSPPNRPALEKWRQGGRDCLDTGWRPQA